MIKELTKEQEEQLIIYKDKWLKIGLSTERINRKFAIETFVLFNKFVLNEKKLPIFIFMDSPLTAWIAPCNEVAVCRRS